MSSDARLLIALAALKSIAEYDHAEGCTHSAPVHECVCQDHDERDIAKAVLEELDE